MIHPTFSGILTYRLFKDGPKPILKIVHAVIMITVFMLTVIALIAVFDFHNLNLKPIPNMYSVHSWMGLLTVILFSFQVCKLGNLEGIWKNSIVICSFLTGTLSFFCFKRIFENICFCGKGRWPQNMAMEIDCIIVDKSRWPQNSSGI